MDNKALLEWQFEAGVDEAVGESPTNHFARASAPVLQPPIAEQAAPAAGLGVSTSSTLKHSPSAAQAVARQLADAATTLEELKAAITGFDGCAIKKTATQTVFADGNPLAKVLVIGEAPGAQEDIQGIPFCGVSGQLLDRMLASIGLDRTTVYISNTVYWRPPGNRQPSVEETQICLPFVEKLIALVAPRLMILSGGTATSTVLARDTSLSKLRGKFYEYTNQYLTSPIQVAVTYHPSYLLRSPAQKRLAWADLQEIAAFLAN